MDNEHTAKLAVLIDADNAQPSIIERLLAEVVKYGTAHVKRAYGDWTGTSLKGWKDHLLKQSIQPIQQFSYTTGKNATDAALVIDAMDLLYSERFDGFCIVSSDSDFTRLAARIRESGLTVYGFGERKTPKPFVAACDKFIYTENLTYTQTDGQLTGGLGRQDRSARLRDSALLSLLRNVVEETSGDDGWAHLGNVGNLVRKRQPDFDPRSYGFPKLMPLVEATRDFEVDKREPGDGNSPVVFVRNRGAGASPAPSDAPHPTHPADPG
ncbi:NYN domain-containing protein [Streptomyces sp. AJS327]|uniref:NYN domain-containing protein n=1 Tax=Streptomyces sp. AJS327 TaxID=2545265 RepID=UPI0015E049F5|nr:NYN domain-containing protein [Streptomyces sp. AJS327]MBA0053941.1 NYN domain-containing protein [Streptomyces sp. AJS327]